MKNQLYLQLHQAQDLIFKSKALDYPLWEQVWWDIPPCDPTKCEWDFVDELVHLNKSPNLASAVYQVGGMLVDCHVNKRQMNVTIAGHNKEEILAHFEFLRERHPAIKEAENGLIDLKFHFLTQQGPNYISRKIAVPDWNEISYNYENETRKNLEHLFNNFKASHGGQLLLFQGQPGTGKSFALRALCDAWREWCSVEYIVDPDAFFGGSSSYLMNLLSDSNDMYGEDDDDEDETIHIGNGVTFTPVKKKAWKLFILEDTGELLTEDAKDRVGQGLGRLLNVVDGFIGQGLQILILITSNEDLGKLHPAVSRPGRAASIIKFNPLDRAHASAWAKKRNFRLEYPRNYTLAELFSLANKFDNQAILDRPQEIGFRERPIGA